MKTRSMAEGWCRRFWPIRWPHRRAKPADAKKNWATNHQIRWRYFSKLITYQNRCPENDLANELTGGECDSGYWLYAELPGYRNKVQELEFVAKYMVEYLIDDPPNKAEEE